MGKAKRFNTYDSDVANQRNVIQGYGQARQNLSIGSSFRNQGLSAPIAVSTGASSGTGTGKFITSPLTGDQTTTIGTNNHIKFYIKDDDVGI